MLSNIARVGRMVCVSVSESMSLRDSADEENRQ